MNSIITFRTVKPVGELQPDEYVDEVTNAYEIHTLVLPAYKDRLQYDGKIYIVQDVIHNLDDEEIQILAVRRTNDAL